MKNDNMSALSLLIERYTYAKNRSTKTKIIDEATRVFSISRKYAIHLLNGTRTRGRRRRGRGKTYGDDVANLLIRIWNATGCECTLYLHAQIKQLMDEYEDSHFVSDSDSEAIRRMSRSTMDRILKGIPRQAIGSVRRRTQYRKSHEFDFIEECSGERPPAFEIIPGDVQIDTVALCGGDMSGDFFWIITVTDRATQITEIRPIWNKGATGVFKALDEIIAAFPFKIWRIHSDNGCEFINYHLLRFVKKHKSIQFARSRPRTCNDNAHVEQKNGAIVRKIFGERRFDRLKDYAKLREICIKASEYFNFARPCRMTIQKTKRINRKGFQREYDKPLTPAERAINFGNLRDEDAMKAKLVEARPIQMYKNLTKLVRSLIGVKSTCPAPSSSPLNASRCPAGDVTIPAAQDKRKTPCNTPASVYSQMKQTVQRTDHQKSKGALSI